MAMVHVSLYLVFALERTVMSCMLIGKKVLQLTWIFAVRGIVELAMVAQ